jgi:predicted HNH restriction endonuclease
VAIAKMEKISTQTVISDFKKNNHDAYMRWKLKHPNYKRKNQKERNAYSRQRYKDNTELVKSQREKSHLKHPETRKNYYKKNKEKIKLYNKERKNIRKREIIKLLGSKCFKCNVEFDGSNLCIFDLHHIIPKIKEKRYDWLEDNFDLSKIMVLCSNCHRLEHHKREEI